MNIKRYLQQILATIGLTEGEAEMYCAVLSAPECDASYLKNKLSFSMAGIYKMLHALSEKGFLIPSYERGVPLSGTAIDIDSASAKSKKSPITFTAVPLDKIAKKFDVDGRKMQRTAGRLADLAKLSVLPSEVEVFEESDLTDFYLNIPAKIDDFIWCVGSFEAVMEFFGPATEKEFIKNRARRGAHADAIIFDDSELSKELAGRDAGEKRETKFIRNGNYPLEFSYLFGDTFLSFYKDSEGDLKMTRIESPEVARAKLIQSQKLWGSTEE